jgi:hypothetical protein
MSDLAGSQGHVSCAPASESCSLPPLPEPRNRTASLFYINCRDAYTADEMRAYAALVLEEAAKVCEGQYDEHNDLACNARIHDAAAAIRALKS